MTREELIGKIVEEMGYIDSASLDNHEALATLAIDIIFDAMKEPTEDMYDEGLSYDDCGVGAIYRAMLNASPLAKEG